MKKVIILIIACLTGILLHAQEQNLHWTPEAGNYQFYMALTCVVEIDGVEQTTDQLEVGAFCGEQCRGAQMVELFELPEAGNFQRYVVYLSIFGTEGESMSFKLFDHRTNQELDLTSPAPVSWTQDPTEYDEFDPYVLNFTGGTTGGGDLHWTPEIGDFQFYMALTCVVQIDGVEQTTDQFEVGAFCGEQCRGARMVELFELPEAGNFQRYVVYLSIFGTEGESMSFKLFDHRINQELDLTSPAPVAWTQDPNEYDEFDPYVLNFTSAPSGFHFTTSGNWSTASNWSGGTVPGAEDEAFIDADCTLDSDATVAALSITEGKVLTLQTGKTLTVTGTLANSTETGLVIEDGAQLVNASAGVKATMKKEITAHGTDPNGWYTIASPMNAMPIEGSGFLAEGYDLYRFNETNMSQNEWENYRAGHADFTTFENGRGYLYANSNTISPAFTGTLNNAAVSYNLTYTNRPTDEFDGFNLIGNPFPHVIYKGAGGAIDNAKLASGYYTLSHEGAWHVHPYSEAIQPGQGVLVKATEATALSIAKSNAVATGETGSAKAVGLLSLNVIGNNGEDRAYAYLSPGVGLDKMNSFDETAPLLYIRDNGHDYAIAHLDSQSETMDLMFRNKQAGSYTLKVGYQGLSFTHLHLVDHITGADIDLLQQPSYTFQATGNEYEARFMLVFRNNTGVEENIQQSFCFVKDRVLYFNEDVENAKLTVTDMLGRTVRQMTLDNTSCDLSTLSEGVYVVGLNKGNEMKVQKIVIK